MKLGTAFCPYCQKQVIAEKEGKERYLLWIEEISGSFIGYLSAFG